MELEESTIFLTSDRHFKASHQDRMVLAQDRNRDQWNKTEIPEMNHALMDSLAFTKEAKIYKGEKTISLTSGSGKTGQPPVKE